MEKGIYLVGCFIELSRENRVNRETGERTNADYVTITTGGRRGVLAVKFDANDISREAFTVLNDLSLGDDVVCRVTMSCMNNVVYYRLVDIAPAAAAVGDD